MWESNISTVNCMSVVGFFSVTNLFLILFLIYSRCCLIFAAVVSYCAPMMHPTIGILELNPSDTRLRPGMSRNTIIRVSRWISQSGVIPLDHFSSSHVNRVPQGWRLFWGKRQTSESDRLKERLPTCLTSAPWIVVGIVHLQGFTCVPIMWNCRVSFYAL